MKEGQKEVRKEGQIEGRKERTKKGKKEGQMEGRKRALDGKWAGLHPLGGPYLGHGPHV